MSKIPVIIDCDTGVDDALALLAAYQLPQLDIQAITTVAGNVTLEKTTRNTLQVLDLIGAKTPVYKGAALPLFREQVVAPYIHGESGLNNLILPDPARKPEETAACDAIYQYARKFPGELEIIAVGPLTNLGLALVKYRELPGLLKRIIIMGGAAVGGNTTPAAEFNIYVDPEAADIVFRCGVPVHMCGLDVTMKSFVTPEEMEDFAKLGTPVGKFVRDVTQGVLDFSIQHGVPGMCMHDPLTVIYAADNSLFTFEEAGVRIELKGKITYGKTVTDIYSDKQFEEKNAVVVTDLDHAAFKKKLFDLIEKY